MEWAVVVLLREPFDDAQQGAWTGERQSNHDEHGALGPPAAKSQSLIDNLGSLGSFRGPYAVRSTTFTLPWRVGGLHGSTGCRSIVIILDAEILHFGVPRYLVEWPFHTLRSPKTLSPYSLFLSFSFSVSPSLCTLKFPPTPRKKWLKPSCARRSSCLLLTCAYDTKRRDR